MSGNGSEVFQDKVFQALAERLAKRFTPSIVLKDHIDTSSSGLASLEAGDDTLRGIEFAPLLERRSENPTILKVLTQAKDSLGQPPSRSAPGSTGRTSPSRCPTRRRAAPGSARSGGRS